MDEQGGIAITTEQRAQVERQLRRTDLTRRMRERLEMVKAAALGDDVERIARWSGRSVARVQHWVARFVEGGVDALADAPRSGRPVHADAAYLAAMEAALETPPTQLGLAFDVWTSDRLSAYLEQQTGVRICAGWLRVLLGQRGWVCGRPKHTLKHLQDPAAVAASRTELGAVGGKGAGRAGTLRTPVPGRDPSGNQSVPVPDLAPQGKAADAASRRDQSAPHGGRAASRPSDALASSWCARRRTAPGSGATWSSWRRATRPCSGRSLWCSITARLIPAT